MHTRKPTKKGQGFTLIELLISVGVIGILAAAVLVAVDPVKRIQDGRDARRSSEANAILNAILTKQVDDVAYYNAAQDAPIITQTGANVQVIVTSSSGIVCNAQATRPGCNRALDVAGANKNCVANLSDTITGTGTATSSGTAVTGSSTLFTSETRVGDLLTSASGGTCTVATITSDIAIVCSNTPSPPFAGAFTDTLKNPLVSRYIGSMPIDPRGSGSASFCGTGSGCTTLGNLAIGSTNTGYYITRNASNRIEVGSCKGEQTEPISVKR